MKNMLLKGKWFVWDILFQNQRIQNKQIVAMYVLTESDSDGNGDHISWEACPSGWGSVSEIQKKPKTLEAWRNDQ